MSKIPTPDIFSLSWFIREALSKSILQYSSDIIPVTVSFGSASFNGDPFGNGCDAKNFARTCPFIAFWGTYSMSYCVNSMAHLATLELNEHVFIIRILMGLT